MSFSSLNITLTENKAYPKYIQLRDQLEQFIRKQHIPGGTQLPNVLSLSQQVGLSNRSVDHAYRLLIDDGICFRRPKKGTFVQFGKCYSDNAETSDMPCVCGILNSKQANLESDHIFAPIYAGVRQFAQENGIDLIVLSVNSLKSYRDNFGTNFLGVLVLCEYDQELLQQCLNDCPDLRFVFINYQFPDFENTSQQVRAIFNDDFAGGFAAGDFIFSQGYSQPRILSLNLGSRNYCYRVDGIRLAAQYHGIDWQDHWTWFCPRHMRNDEEHLTLGHDYITGLIKDGESVDAVFCTNDLLACGVASALDQLNLRNQIQVIGYDNVLPYLSQNGRFSTVAIHFREMGRRALSMLLNPEGMPKIIRIAPQLLIRQYSL
ncbi:MAG: substrate-binding domain-containing protein [Oligosphaeraceae bacterium]|nr:substrate-binding domain-containing protein [Oligosphaeraceae bacterium]